MSAMLFFQIAALIVIFSLCSLALTIAIGALYIKYMPAIMAKAAEGFEGLDVDQHYDYSYPPMNPVGENPFK